MPRPGTTSTRGYDAQHQARVAALKRQMRDGDLCARGGEPLYRWQLALPSDDPRSIDGDHLGELAAAGTGALPDGLSCAHHNRQHGARIRNTGVRSRKAQQQARRQPPIW